MFTRTKEHIYRLMEANAFGKKEGSAFFCSEIFENEIEQEIFSWKNRKIIKQTLQHVVNNTSSANLNA